MRIGRRQRKDRSAEPSLYVLCFLFPSICSFWLFFSRSSGSQCSEQRQILCVSSALGAELQKGGAAPSRLSLHSVWLWVWSDLLLCASTLDGVDNMQEFTVLCSVRV